MNTITCGPPSGDALDGLVEDVAPDAMVVHPSVDAGVFGVEDDAFAFGGDALRSRHSLDIHNGVSTKSWRYR